MKRLLTVNAFLAILLGLVAGVDAQRSHSAMIKYRDERGREREEKSANVLKHSYKGIEFKVGARKPRVVTDDKILAIKYRSTPDEYTEAVALYDEGAWLDAMDALAPILSDESVMRRHGGWMKQEILFRLWDSARRANQSADAASFRKQLLAVAAESRYLPRLRLLEAQALATSGDAKARPEFERFKKDAKSKGYAALFVFEADCALVDLHLRKGTTSSAKTLVSEMRAAANAAGETEFVQRADVFLGRVLLADKKYKDALRHFDRLLKNSSKAQRHLVSGAANGRGESNFALGKFDQAMYDFSIAPSLYFDDLDLEEDVGWALWMWATSAKRHAGTLKDDHPDKKRYNLRFNSLRRRVANEYPLTRGGREARKSRGS